MATPLTVADVVRTIEIAASREIVFRYFVDSQRFARWWGPGSSVDPRPGGAVRICYPGGQVASGHFKEIAEPERVIFSYGYEGEGQPIAPGMSTVSVYLEEIPSGTRVTLRHAGIPSEEVFKEHVGGWRYQLSLFSKTVGAELHTNAGRLLDQWFEAWAETDPRKRRELIEACAAPGITFHDPFSALAGYEDLESHIAAAQHFMPGSRSVRAGEPLVSHGDALVRWEIRNADGQVAGKGLNAVTFAPDGRLLRVTGFWDAP
jgi:uncharacterized protein YndB with AHSA1/START domain